MKIKHELLAITLLLAMPGQQAMAAREIRQEAHSFHPAITRPTVAEGFVAGEFSQGKSLRPAATARKFPVVAVKVGPEGPAAESLAQPQADKPIAPKKEPEGPAPVGQASAEPNRPCLLSVVHFKLGSAKLNQGGIDQITTALKRCEIAASTQLRVVGYTCDLGSDSLNAGLSQARAQAVAHLLRGRGYTVVEAVGSLERLFSEPAIRRLNRRVEIQIKEEI